MNRKQILAHLSPAESTRSHLNNQFLELDHLLDKVTSYKIPVTINAKENYASPSNVVFIPIDCNPQFSSKDFPFVKVSCSDLFKEQKNNRSHGNVEYGLEPSFFMVQSAGKFIPISGIVSYDDSISNWDEDREIISEYFRLYRESLQTHFLVLIHQILVRQRQELIDRSNELRNLVRHLRRKLLSPYQQIKSELIKNLLCFHIKRYSNNSDDEDSLNFISKFQCISLIFNLIKRICYAYFRKRNYHRKVEFCYIF
jgi:hypothetical protein